MIATAASVEDLTRQYQAELAKLARQQYTNAGLREDWLDYTLPRLAEPTKPNWISQSGRLLEWAETTGRHFLNVQRKDAAAYVEWLRAGKYEGHKKGKPVSASNVWNHLVVASIFYDYLADVRGLLHVSPFKGMVKAFMKDHKAEIRPELRGLDVEDAFSILQGAEDLDDFLLGLLVFKTGGRRTELASIRMDLINWTGRFIALAPHRKRTHLRLYFDEEVEFFLRLKCEKNAREYPGNPYLWPSPEVPGKHVFAGILAKRFKAMIQRSPMAAQITDWTDRMQKVTMHTGRRAFTSWLKANGCPDHIVAILRGDSLRARSELVTETTQGIYTKMGKKGGVDELRYWFGKCMPKIGACEAWESVMPVSPYDAASVPALLRVFRWREVFKPKKILRHS